MYRNVVPILATLIISGGAQQLCAADHQPVHQQQAELQCAVCHCQENLGDALFLVCNDHLLVAHKECMRLQLESNDMRCPDCNHELSEANKDLMLTSLSGRDVMPQATPAEPKAQSRAAPSHWELVNRGMRTLESAEAGYADLKRLVFEKMGPDFAAAFNARYPQSSKEAVEQLAQHIDHIGMWYECYPPYAFATIGSQETCLGEDVGLIIYNMDQIYECGTPFVN